MNFKEINIFGMSDDKAAKNNKTEQTAYIVFMMVGSYFEACSFANEFLEKSFYLSYMEMKDSTQGDVEERVENEFLRRCAFRLDSLAALRATVRVSRKDDGLVIRFETGFEEISVEISKTGRRTYHFAYPSGVTVG